MTELQALLCMLPMASMRLPECFFEWTCLNNLQYTTGHNYVLYMLYMYGSIRTPLKQLVTESMFQDLADLGDSGSLCLRLAGKSLCSSFSAPSNKRFSSASILFLSREVQEDVQLIFCMDTLGRISVTMLHQNETAPQVCLPN